MSKPEVQRHLTRCFLRLCFEFSRCRNKVEKNYLEKNETVDIPSCIHVLPAVELWLHCSKDVSL